jgi:hypothetical protein
MPNSHVARECGKVVGREVPEHRGALRLPVQLAVQARERAAKDRVAGVIVHRASDRVLELI